MRSVRILLITCVLILIGVMVYDSIGAKRTGFVVNGESLSKDELSTGIKEARKVFADVQDKGGAQASQQPTKTKLGQLVSDLAAKGAEIEKWHTSATGSHSLDECLSPNAFKSSKSLRDALTQIDELERIESEWIARRKSLMDEFLKSVGKNPNNDARIQQNKMVLDAFLDAEKAVFESVRDYLRLGLEKSPAPDLAKGIIYWNEPDLPRAQRILDEISARGKEVTRQEDHMKELAAQGLKALDEASSP